MARYSFYCGGVRPPRARHAASAEHLMELDYRPGSPSRRIILPLPDFIRDLYDLPPRYADLLEVAAYVFSADRLAPRGPTEAVEFQAWARELAFAIPVRDLAFWRRSGVQDALRDVLLFMSGDRQFEFRFVDSDAPVGTSLFTGGEFHLPQGPASVLLFSGGLDSLAGALTRLEAPGGGICLVSHQASPSVKHTQHALAEGLKDRFPGRVTHYRFPLSLRGVRAPEETQRTRAFLFTSVAAAIAYALGKDEILVFENGVTSLNFPRREDLINARASRTTHPKTLSLLSGFFSLLAGKSIRVANPFENLTKAEVIRKLQASGQADLMTSAVSCSKTFRRLGVATHCGTCLQCIDRRIAVYAAEAEKIDTAGLYSTDIARDPIVGREEKTAVVDYLRQAAEFSEVTADALLERHLVETTEVIDDARDEGELEVAERLADLLRRHGEEVRHGLERIRAANDDVFDQPRPGSLAELISTREYLRTPTERLAGSVAEILQAAVPQMFRRNEPADEPDLNQKIHAILDGHVEKLRSEFPSVPFACSGFVPDHTVVDSGLVVESKYLRKGTTAHKAAEAMAADLTKRPQGLFILFVVYDPSRLIPDDRVFRRDFEDRGECRVLVVR